jgi:spore coat protein CotF
MEKTMTPTIEDVLKKHCPLVYGTMLDSIKAAMTEYASLNRQGWTRVEDGLPETGKRVLVFELDEFLESHINIAKYTEDGDWYAPFRIRYDVKYWMPLPNKPEPI